MGLVTHSIDEAVTSLAAGHLCAIPTETVYGLAADASNRTAVRDVFSAKRRPAEHPLIVHVADTDDIDRWITTLPHWAHSLITEFMPGPLTIVGSRAAHVLDDVTGGQGTVAVRVPSHPMAHAALVELRSRGIHGLVAPSANRFGHVSPTTAQHVVDDLGDWLSAHGGLVLDGGACTIGVESTIVLVTGDFPVVLRSGAVTSKMIEECTGLEVHMPTANSPRTSGSLASHYAPRAHVIEISEADLNEAVTENPEVGVIAFAEVTTPAGAVRLASPSTAEEYAAQLYGALRQADAQNLASVFVVLPTDAGIAEAIRDRVARAAAARETAD